ncbi:MAG TPA: DUF488 domain-containing protein [Caulobacteraceae bacterium]|nr:DUF488 domain-containing protein [Caulobacteraceae bacterium]
MKLRTIGYENATQSAVIDCLKRAGVEVLLDVRAIASSRRAGFSKSLLRAGLAEAGIDYVHLRGLGTPKAGRQAVRAGHPEEMRRIYEAHLAEPQAQLELAEAKEIVAERPAALLCYEADAANCHRRIVAARLADAIGALEIEDLTA